MWSLRIGTSANYFVQVWLILSLKRWQKMSMSDCVKKQHSNQRKERNPKWALIKIYSLSTNVRDAQIHVSWQNLGLVILDHDEIIWLSLTSSTRLRPTSWRCKLLGLEVGAGQRMVVLEAARAVSKSFPSMETIIWRFSSLNPSSRSARPSRLCKSITVAANQSNWNIYHPTMQLDLKLPKHPKLSTHPQWMNEKAKLS